MKQPITEDEYRLLKIFPANGKYLKRDKIENACKKLFTEDKLYEILQGLHYIDYLNGNFDGVGLRIMPDALYQIKAYRKTTTTERRAKAALLIAKIALGISAVTLLITVTSILLSRYKIWPFDK